MNRRRNISHGWQKNLFIVYVSDFNLDTVITAKEVVYQYVLGT